MEETAPPDVDVKAKKALNDAKAYKTLKKFLKKDREKPATDQLPEEVAHQLERVRDSLEALRDGDNGGAGLQEEEEAAPVPAGSTEKPKKKKHKTK